MEEVVLEYDSVKGSNSISLKADSEVIKLGKKKITSIDLEPLSKFSKLKRLWINSNQIKSIDLSPLSHCAHLEILSISDNLLASIDLASLRHCTKLNELYLHRNELESIDLEPLRNSKNLSILFLDRNRLKRITLDPLFDCCDLSEIRLWKNLMPSVDVTPFFFLSRFRTLHVEEDRSLTMDTSVKILAEKMETNRFLQDAIKRRRIEWQDYTALSIRSGWQGVRSRLLEIIERTDEIYSSELAEGFYEAFKLPASQSWKIDLKDILLSVPEDISYSEALRRIEEKFGSD
ncbi:MAG: leucine-rich repeat domain-containing protein [Candidatus Thorarchaeota archaeon]|jgi:Leucine-rich repeat (LRR) protein